MTARHGAGRPNDFLAMHQQMGSHLQQHNYLTTPQSQQATNSYIPSQLYNFPATQSTNYVPSPQQAYNQYAQLQQQTQQNLYLQQQQQQFDHQTRMHANLQQMSKFKKNVIPNL